MYACSTHFYVIIDHWMCAHSHVYYNNDHRAHIHIQKYKMHLYIANVPSVLVEYSTTDL